MKTTVLLDDDLYQWLAQEAVRRHGTTKRLSATLNAILNRTGGLPGELAALVPKEERSKTHRRLAAARTARPAYQSQYTALAKWLNLP